MCSSVLWGLYTYLKGYCSSQLLFSSFEDLSTVKCAKSQNTHQIQGEETPSSAGQNGLPAWGKHTVCRADVGGDGL